MYLNSSHYKAKRFFILPQTTIYGINGSFASQNSKLVQNGICKSGNKHSPWLLKVSVHSQVSLTTPAGDGMAEDGSH